MIYREIKADLFDYCNDRILAHCVSADFALGAGIAVAFDKRYGMRRKLLSKYPDMERVFYAKPPIMRGEALRIEDTVNLVTKLHYWDKPTYTAITNSLIAMKKLLPNDARIAMPFIGCGLDGKNWARVSSIIYDVFRDTDCDILICHR